MASRSPGALPSGSRAGRTAGTRSGSTCRTSAVGRSLASHAAVLGKPIASAGAGPIGPRNESNEKSDSHATSTRAAVLPARPRLFVVLVRVSMGTINHR